MRGVELGFVWVGVLGTLVGLLILWGLQFSDLFLFLQGAKVWWGLGLDVLFWIGFLLWFRIFGLVLTGMWFLICVSISVPFFVSGQLSR